jgi:hypothetical protein
MVAEYKVAVQEEADTHRTERGRDTRNKFGLVERKEHDVQYQKIERGVAYPYKTKPDLTALDNSFDYFHRFPLW